MPIDFNTCFGCGKSAKDVVPFSRVAIINNNIRWVCKNCVEKAKDKPNINIFTKEESDAITAKAR